MTALKLADLPYYTYEDYKTWEGRWELIYGVPYAMAPMPSMHHQDISGLIYSQLLQILSTCKNCRTFLPIDFKIDEETVLQPDVLVVCHPFEMSVFLSKTPEIVFEILSPKTKQKDLNIKYEIYEKVGVKYYVIVDPIKKQCFVYQLVDGKYILALTTETGNFVFETDGCPIDFDFGKIWLFSTL